MGDEEEEERKVIKFREGAADMRRGEERGEKS